MQTNDLVSAAVRSDTAGGAFIPQKKTSRIKRDIKRNYSLYLIFLPVFIYFVIFNYWPMAGIFMAFQDYDIAKGMFGSPWVGFKHFTNFFNDFYFNRLLTNTVVYSILGIVFVFPMPILLALLINSINKKMVRRGLQTAVYLPFFISTVVVAGMLKSFLEPDGFIGAAFGALGIVDEGVFVLGEPRFFRGIIIVSDIWQGTGFSSIVYVAALSSIDKTLYEAASIDGAGRAANLFKITLPSILPMIMFMLVLKFGTLLSVNAEKITLLYSATTFEVADVFGSYVYRLGLAEGHQYSYTTAIGFFNTVISLILLAISNYISKKTTSFGLV